MKATMISPLIVAIATSTLSTFGASVQNNSRTPGVALTPSDVRKTTSRGLELSASIEKASFSPGEAILLRICARNNSRKVLVLVDTYHPEWDYKFEVKNEAGESVKLTEDGEHLVKNIAIYKQVTVDIYPGEDVQKDFLIDKLFEMTAPGTYSITVKRQFFIPDANAFSVATSNTVKFEIAH